jgi:hypothetical protein
MTATILFTLAFLACLAGLGVGVVATLVGTIVAVLAQPGDLSIEIPPRAAGVAAMLLGLLIFVVAATLLARSIV